MSVFHSASPASAGPVFLAVGRFVAKKGPFSRSERCSLHQSTQPQVWPYGWLVMDQCSPLLKRWWSNWADCCSFSRRPLPVGSCGIDATSAWLRTALGGGF